MNVPAGHPSPRATASPNRAKSAIRGSSARRTDGSWRIRLEPRAGFERFENAAHGPVGWQLALFFQITVNQPGAKRRALECENLVAVSDRYPSVKTAIDRAAEPRPPRQPHQGFLRGGAVRLVLGELLARQRFDHAGLRCDDV